MKYKYIGRDFSTLQNALLGTGIGLVGGVGLGGAVHLITKEDAYKTYLKQCIARRETPMPKDEFFQSDLFKKMAIGGIAGGTLGGVAGTVYGLSKAEKERQRHLMMSVLKSSQSNIMDATPSKPKSKSSGSGNGGNAASSTTNNTTNTTTNNTTNNTANNNNTNNNTANTATNNNAGTTTTTTASQDIDDLLASVVVEDDDDSTQQIDDIIASLDLEDDGLTETNNTSEVVNKMSEDEFNKILDSLSQDDKDSDKLLKGYKEKIEANDDKIDRLSLRDEISKNRIQEKKDEILQFEEQIANIQDPDNHKQLISDLQTAIERREKFINHQEFKIKQRDKSMQKSEKENSDYTKYTDSLIDDFNDIFDGVKPKLKIDDDATLSDLIIDYNELKRIRSDNSLDSDIGELSSRNQDLLDAIKEKESSIASSLGQSMAKNNKLYDDLVKQHLEVKSQLDDKIKQSEENGKRMSELSTTIKGAWRNAIRDFSNPFNRKCHWDFSKKAFIVEDEYGDKVKIEEKKARDLALKIGVAGAGGVAGFLMEDHIPVLGDASIGPIDVGGTVAGTIGLNLGSAAANKIIDHLYTKKAIKSLDEIKLNRGEYKKLLVRNGVTEV